MGALKNDFFGQSLVDNIPQPLGTCFRCKSKTAFLYILHLIHDIQGKSIDPKRRQGNIDFLSSTVFNQKIQQFRQF